MNFSHKKYTDLS